MSLIGDKFVGANSTKILHRNLTLILVKAKSFATLVLRISVIWSQEVEIVQHASRQKYVSTLPIMNKVQLNFTAKNMKHLTQSNLLHRLAHGAL